MVTGVIALTLAVLSQLRQAYDVALMRQLLFGALVLAGGMALFNIVLGRVRWLSA